VRPGPPNGEAPCSIPSPVLRRMLPRMSPALTVLTLVFASATPRIAVLPLEAGEGVSAPTARAVTEAVVAEVRKRPGTALLTPDEVQSLLAVERQRAVLGCGDSACAGQVGSALGADQLLAGSVARLGQSWLVHLKLLDTRSAGQVVQATRRLKDRGIDDVLDVLPAMVAELFGPQGAATAPAVPAAPAPSTAAAASSSGGEDTAFSPRPPRLTLLTDGSGSYVAVAPYGSTETPLFAGDAKRLYAQRVIGSSATGDTAFDYVFWDPRVRDGWQRSLSFKDEKYALQCGQKAVAYRAVPPAEAKRVLAGAQLLRPRWRRQVHALARDDAGTYYLVDAPRETEGVPTPSADDGVIYRLFVGPKGKLRELALNDAVSDSAGTLLLTPEGALQFSADGAKATWKAAGATTALTPVPLDESAAALAYGKQGPYRDDPLRTACDPHR
jgi:TolB-like protein